MSLFYNSKVLTLFLGMYASLAFSQEIVSFNVEPGKVVEGTEAVFRVNLAKPFTNTNVWCGLRIEFGNGESKNIRVGEDGDKDLNLTYKYTFPNAGTYSASVVGVYMSRGLKSATACMGNKRIYKIVVDSKKPVIIAPAKPLVTADLPSSFNPPIDQDKLQAITASNPGFKDAIQGYTIKKLRTCA